MVSFSFRYQDYHRRQEGYIMFHPPGFQRVSCQTDDIYIYIYIYIVFILAISDQGSLNDDLRWLDWIF